MSHISTLAVVDSDMEVVADLLINPILDPEDAKYLQADDVIDIVMNKGYTGIEAEADQKFVDHLRKELAGCIVIPPNEVLELSVIRFTYKEKQFINNGVSREVMYIFTVEVV